MDVLNTYGGGTNIACIILAIIFVIVALAFLALAIFANEPGLLIGTLVFALITLGSWMSASEPVTHEVTLRPGSVIDAVKYDIVEQRGAIFVIEERTQNAK